MTAITFRDGTLEVDAGIVAGALDLSPEALRSGLQRGDITTLCEKGEAEDAGRFRVTFFTPTRRLRLIVDAGGAILQTSTADFSRRPGQPNGPPVA